MIVSIDPGLRGCGVALWDDAGDLMWAGYVKGAKVGRGAPAWRITAEMALASVLGFGAPYSSGLPLSALVVESQQIHVRGSRKQKASAARGDLTELTGVAATLCALIPARTYLQPLPSEWKRNKEKLAKCAEIARAVEAAGWSSRVVLPNSKKLCLDVWDAVGLGLWAHIRLRVTARLSTPGTL